MSGSEATPQFIAIDHARFRKAQRDIFTVTVVADCMTHECRLITEGGHRKLDACCQYGVDVDLGERDGILAHAEQIAGILNAEVADAAWFKDEEHVDPDFPSGHYVRTRIHAHPDGGEGCVFLRHDGRGCAVHRASIEGGWNFNGIKPHVCRLFPLSYDTESIVLSDDYADYSCSMESGAPSVYRVGRPTLQAVFGVELVAALDAAEREVTGRAAGLSVVS